MSQLVRQYGLHLRRRALVDQSVVQDDLFLGEWQTSEVGVRVSRSLAAINDLQFGKREVELRCEGIDTVFEVTRFERCERVEHWYNQGRVDRDGAELNNEHEDPDVEEELLPSRLDDLEKGGTERDAKGKSESLTLDEVGEEE